MAERSDQRNSRIPGAAPEDEPARLSKLPPGTPDIVYRGGVPPLRQVWKDLKTILKERRESPQRR